MGLIKNRADVWFYCIHLNLYRAPAATRSNLHDGRGLIDVWYCVPEMIVAMNPIGITRTDWSQFSAHLTTF